MPNLNQSFAGTTLVIPGAYYADDVSRVLQPVGAETPPLIFLGYGYGQAPFVPTLYNNPQDLLTAIRGGPCSGYVPFMANPSPTLRGAQQIVYINCSENTRSALSLYSGVSGVITMTSYDYGSPSNLLQAKVENGTQSQTVKVTLYDAFSGRVETADNLGVPFLLAYTGSSSGVTYTVATSGNTALTLSISSPVTGESVAISLDPTAYGTMAQVVEYLNGTGHYSAQVVGNGSTPSSLLDADAAHALTSGTPYTYVKVRATLGPIVWWINNVVQTMAVAAITSGVTSAQTKLPTVATYQSFSGATSVTPSLADYASGFNVALGIPGWATFADSNASGVVALGVQHAETASLPSGGKWRRFFTGSSLGDSLGTASGVATICASERTTYVYPGIYAIDIATNRNTLFDGLHAAAAVAGMATGNPPATPLTNKPLNGTGVEVLLTTSQIDTLQQAGVMPIWIPAQTGLPTIVSDLTTWQLDANPENCFNQQIGCRDYLAYTLSNSAQPYVGTQADPLTEIKILNAVKSALNALLYNSGNANGVLVSWDAKSLQLTYNGTTQTAAITVSVMFVGQNRFITMTVNVLPTTFTVTAG